MQKTPIEYRRCINDLRALSSSKSRDFELPIGGVLRGGYYSSINCDLARSRGREFLGPIITSAL